MNGNSNVNSSILSEFSFDQQKVVNPIMGGGKIRLSLLSVDSIKKRSSMMDKERMEDDSFFDELDYIDEEDNSSKSNEFIKEAS
jgi:hypothetical protein